MSGIGCFEVGSIGVGYACLANVSAEQKVEILEASIVGGARFMALLRGDARAIGDALKAAQKLALADSDGVAPTWESFALDHEPAGLLDAIYSLSDQALDESLVVCEASSMSAMLSAAPAFLGDAALRALEVKSLRGGTAGALGFFTGPSAACGLAAEGARLRMKASGFRGRVETIDRPGAAFRAHFAIGG